MTLGRPGNRQDATKAAPATPTSATLSNSEPAAESRAEFVPPARYRIVRRLGEGGMGVVYEADDIERGSAVALKTLLRFDAAALYRFKREFRTLADVLHPNLVRLYELVVEENERAFFTMELVRGTDFLTYVRKPGVELPPLEKSRVRSMVTVAEGPESQPSDFVARAAAETPQARSPMLVDIDKLRGSMRELVEGVHALHRAGRLHRDLKPSNVLVALDGRVVVLDFGVATELARAADRQPGEAEIVGTLRYMAPEQAVALDTSPAADWYSVGVMLYEALVGRPPFSGRYTDVVAMKVLQDADSPSAQVEGVPNDLNDLCIALLDRDPQKRPLGPEILQRLGVSPSLRPPPSLAPRDRRTRLIGREDQLAALQEAFARVRLGESVTVRVAGASGMGKSAVVQQFVDELTESGAATVLRGRTYERESVPYKAVDSVVDALSRHLVNLEAREEGLALPGEIAALARVFPVLRRVPSIAQVEAIEAAEPRLVRERAFGALRELLTELARRQPLVVFIDDVQWGDADSAALLLELVRQPGAPSVLFLLTHRDGEALSAPFVGALRERWPVGAASREVRVDGLAGADSQRLALALLGASDPTAERIARAVARESGGSPFLIEELVRSNRALSSDPGQTLKTVTLDEMVAQRLQRLPDVSRRVLELVAIGGRPLPVSVVAQAAQVGDAGDRPLAVVQAQRLIHVGVREGREFVETTHDRLREAIVAQLPDERIREHHGCLAAVLERDPGADAEAVAMHLLGAGDTTRAGRFAEKAAEQAASKLAFDQAARLLRLTLETTQPVGQERHRLLVRLAEVLEWSGRGEDAARVYLEAADGTPPLRRAELERAASEQLMAAGRIDEGAAVLYRVLAAVGLSAPRSTTATVFWLVVYGIWAAALGTRYRRRAAADVRPEDRARIDALFAVAMGFAVVDLLLSSCVNRLHLIVALRAGDQFQVLRATTLSTTQLAGTGGPVSKRERALVEVARALADEDTSGEGRDYFDACMGIRDYLRGDFISARAALDGAYPRLRNHRAGWQSNANVFGAWTLMFLGELRELRIRYDRLLADAQARGDLYTAVQLRAGALAYLWLAHDEPEELCRVIRETLLEWSHARFLIQHWHSMIGGTFAELYQGRGAAAYERFMRDLPRLKRSLLLVSQFCRVLTNFVRGCCSVAAAEGPQRTARLAETRRIAHGLDREGWEWSRSYAMLLRAALAQAEGDSQAAIAGLRHSIDAAERQGLKLMVASAQYRLAGLVGGDEGSALAHSAQLIANEQDVRRLDRFANLYLPGTWPSPPG
jgi:serine/threonine protein kinase